MDTRRMVRLPVLALLDSLRPPRPDPIFVLGNQKSGTTAVASLLAKALGLNYSNDMFYNRGWTKVRELHRGQFSIDELVKKAPYDFSKGVIKDPDLTFHLPALFQRFPAAHFIFVVRDPAANLRSLLNRLQLPGNLESLNSTQLPHSTLWRSVFEPEPLHLPGGNYIDVLSQRWALGASTYFDWADKAELIKYEDFVANKEQSVVALAGCIGFKASVELGRLVDKQYQPRGNNSQELGEFYGQRNSQRIASWVKDSASRFGYEGYETS